MKNEYLPYLRSHSSGEEGELGLVTLQKTTFKKDFLEAFNGDDLITTVQNDRTLLEDKNYTLDEVVALLYRLRMSALVALNGADVPSDGESTTYPEHFLAGYEEKIGFSALGKDYPEGQLSDVCLTDSIRRRRYFEWDTATADDSSVGGLLLYYYDESEKEWQKLSIINHLTVDLINTFGLFRRDGAYAFPPELAVLLLTLFDANEYLQQMDKIGQVVERYKGDNPLPLVPGYSEWIGESMDKSYLRLQIDRMGIVSYYERLDDRERMVFDACFDGKHKGVSIHFSDREEGAHFVIDDSGNLQYVYFLNLESSRVFLEICNSDVKLFSLIRHIYEDIRENGKGYIDRDLGLLSQVTEQIKLFSSQLPDRSKNETIQSPW